MNLNDISAQDILNLLVQDVTRELSLWIRSQAELGACSAPQDLSAGAEPAFQPDALPSIGNQTATRGNQTATRGNQTATRGNQTATRGNQTATRGNQTATRGNQTATRGNQTASNGAQTPASGRQTASNGAQAPQPVSGAAKNRAASPAAKSMLRTFAAIQTERSAQGLSESDRRQKLNIFNANLKTCNACGIQDRRPCVHLGSGDVCPRIMFVGLGASAADISAGSFLSAGDYTLFRQWMHACAQRNAGFSPQNIYATTLIKCFFEVTQKTCAETACRCFPQFRKEVEIVRPNVIVAFGETLYRLFFGSQLSIAQVRGQVRQLENIPFIATHHPREILKKLSAKNEIQANEAKRLEERVMNDLDLAISLSKG